jgi:hypothetical protein
LHSDMRSSVTFRGQTRTDRPPRYLRPLCGRTANRAGPLGPAAMCETVKGAALLPLPNCSLLKFLAPLSRVRGTHSCPVDFNLTQKFVDPWLVTRPAAGRPRSGCPVRVQYSTLLEAHPSHWHHREPSPSSDRLCEVPAPALRCSWESWLAFHDILR